MSATTVLLRDKLGLYKAMPKAGPLTSTELHRQQKLSNGMFREWLGNQAAGGYVTYDAGIGRYLLQEEPAMTLTDESSPCFFPGALQVIAGTFPADDKIDQHLMLEARR
jgi:hypothetical protein